MPTLLLRLAGAMQSWGTTSRFDQRDTGKEPSKSGVIGLLAAALGIDRENWTDLKPLTRLSMGVRHDRAGIPKYDYQTVGQGTEEIVDSDGNVQIRSRMILANGKYPSGDKLGEGVQSYRHYLADAAFLVLLKVKIAPCWNELTPPCAILSGLWPWGANLTCLPSRSGLKTACRTLHCGTSWHGGPGSAHSGNGKNSPRSFLSPLSQKTDLVHSRWTNRFGRLPNGASGPDSCGPSGFPSLRR